VAAPKGLVARAALALVALAGLAGRALARILAGRREHALVWVAQLRGLVVGVPSAHGRP